VSWISREHPPNCTYKGKELTFGTSFNSKSLLASIASRVEISLIKLLNLDEGVRLSRNSESFVATRGCESKLTDMLDR